MKINPWRVASYGLLFLSLGNLVAADDPLWGVAALVSYGIVRLEWFISTLTEAKKSDDTYEQEYDGL